MSLSEQLGQYLGTAHNRHEVRIAAPPGNHMLVQMCRDTGPGDRTLINPDAKTRLGVRETLSSVYLQPRTRVGDKTCAVDTTLTSQLTYLTTTMFMKERNLWTPRLADSASRGTLPVCDFRDGPHLLARAIPGSS